MKTFLVGLLLCLVQAPGALAQATPADTASSLKVTIDLGYINAAGNTSVSTLSTGENLVYLTKRFELLQSGSVIYGRSNNVTITEQVKFGTRFNLRFSKSGGFFVGAAYERNRFAGIAKRFEENAGISLRLLETPINTWMLELGGALNQQTSTTGVRTNFSSLRGATSVRHNFTKTAFFQETLEILPTTDNWSDTRLNNETAIVAPISEHVALKVSYLIKFDNVPEPGFRKSDRIFTSAIQVVF